MNLILFDIDGTLLDSVKVDDQCFIQSFSDLYQIDLSDTDWNNFAHVTDSGLTREIFQTYLDRVPSEAEISELKWHFHKLLSQRIDEMIEIKGASKTLNILMDHSECTVAFATGGWKETAMLKLSLIGLETGKAPLVSSSDHFSRLEIIKLGIEEALTQQGLKTFRSITYIGDGIWDFKTSQEAGLDFIGMDYHGTNALLNAGVKRILNDLDNHEQIISWITQTN